ncbi:MAG: hypothetical protein VYA51_12755 [Planctomycetota bacterium]|nr:hypothetical protein [Planctomycetota bacterium]
MIHSWLSAVFSQQPRASQVLIGRRAPGEHLATALTAIEAENPAAFYAINIALNNANEIMALATWTESRFKIAIAQTSDTAVLDGDASTQQVTTETIDTAAAGDWVLTVFNAWTGALVGTATYNAAGGAGPQGIATGLRAAYDGVAELAAITEPAAGVGAAVELTFDGLGNGYIVQLTPPAGGAATQTNAAQVQNVLELGSALGFDRTAVVYHNNDTENLDGSWTSRCLSFNLDRQHSIWAYHELKGIAGTRLSDSQKSTVLGDNGNYYSPVTYTSGLEEDAFTFKGTMLSGRSIDNTTTQDLTQARMEEAVVAAFKQASSVNSKIGMNDDGIQLLGGTVLAELDKLVRASHYADGAVSSITGRRTPYIDTPLVSSLSASQRQSRQVTMSGEAVFDGAIESVGSASVVGIDLVVSF